MLEASSKLFTPHIAPDLLAAGGEMGERLRSHDWTRTAFGPARDWPLGLKIAVRLMLASRQPMCVWWGPAYIDLHNDACRVLLGDRNGTALAQSASLAWGSLWDALAHAAEGALRRNESASLESVECWTQRDGRRERAQFSVAITPVPGEAGTTCGVLCSFVETTPPAARVAELALTKDELAGQVESLTALHELSLRLNGLSDVQPALQAILDTAVEAQHAQFGLVWMHEPETGALVAHASRGFDAPSLLLFERVVPGPDGGEAGNAFARRCRWVIADTETDPSFTRFRESAREAGFRSVHSTPIVTRSGELLGVLSVHHSGPRRPTQRDMQMADLCARHAADAIEAYRGQEALRRSERVEDELRELDQRKDEFLATLAHELRNPLAPLRNGIEVMKLAADDAATTAKARAMMERQLQQLVRLVDDLLDVSRVSRGKVELRRDHIELAAVLRNAMETSQPPMAERGHEVVADIPAERIVVYGDMTRLAQVFGNLLNNAAKYTGPGGRVELAVRLLDGEAAVSVKDNGVGIPEHMLPRVFDIFTQVDRSLDKAQGGLGIGLSIAKRLVEMHGGRIEARSAGHAKGSEFTVFLPTIRA